MLEASTNDEIDIANCFIKMHTSFFKLYSVYCQNYKTYNYRVFFTILLLFFIENFFHINIHLKIFNDTLERIYIYIEKSYN